jgi:chromosome partitioning protein
MKRVKLFVVGNEKGGAGKTTCSMHLISGLLEKGLKVGSIDIDTRQRSLTRYIENRKVYNEKHSENKVKMPIHFVLNEGKEEIILEKEKLEKKQFEEILAKLKQDADVIVIDTPGSHTYLSRLAHSYADTVITPINDSFLDIDVLAIVGEELNIITPSIYSEMIWKQKMERAKRDGSSIEWIIMRNRLSNLDAINKRNVGIVLDSLSKRISFKIAPGFSERVIFRELFLQGLTLIDIIKAKPEKGISVSHIAARQELRDFFKYLNIEELSKV